MEMNLNQFRAFYLAVKHKSITVAASRLFVTQPAVSMQIKALEENLGARLFQKYGKDMTLTKPGDTLYGYAERIFRIVEEMEYAMQGYTDLSHGTLTIGTTRSFAKYLMPGLISRFQEIYPSIKVKLGERSSQEIADAVLAYEYDLGIIGNIPPQSRLKIIPYSKEEFYLVTSAQHRFGDKAEISLKEIEKEPIIIREAGSGSRHMVLSFLESRGIKPSVLIETGSVEFIKEYVIKGRGISFLYGPEVESEAREGLLKIHRILGNPIILQTNIVLPSDAEPSPPVQAFLRLIKKMDVP